MTRGVTPPLRQGFGKQEMLFESHPGLAPWGPVNESQRRPGSFESCDGAARELKAAIRLKKVVTHDREAVIGEAQITRSSQETGPETNRALGQYRLIGGQRKRRRQLV